MLITGDTNASGLSVLSDEYSYPISTILTFFMRPIELEIAIILHSIISCYSSTISSGN